MYRRAIIAIASLLTIVTEANAQRTCHVVECRQVRAGEVCTIRPCQNPRNLVCYRGRYTVGDGNRVSQGGSQGQCEQRCSADQNCNFLEYYYGNEGVKCNLYYGTPQIRWNSARDATICAWEG